MQHDRLSIGELADAAGLTRRAIRFYVQQKLIPAPHGLGRGKHYDASHLQKLLQIIKLQRSGHSLDHIRHLMSRSDVDQVGQDACRSPDFPEPAEMGAQDGANGDSNGNGHPTDAALPGAALPPPPASARPLAGAPTEIPAEPQPTPARLRAELWRRLRLLEGVELSFDATRFNPTVEDLLAMRQALLAVFHPGLAEPSDPEE